MVKRAPETDVAKAAIAWLEREGWDVYQEVRPGPGEPIADIVALRDKYLAVIEAKAAASLHVLAQIAGWTRYATHLYIAVPFEPGKAPYTGKKRLHFGARRIDREVRELVRDWCAARGIGILTSGGEAVASQAMPATERAMASEDLRNAIRPEHKTYAAAGTQGSRSFTPYKQSCKAIADYVREHRGSTIPEVVRALGKLHYSGIRSATSSLYVAANKGVIEGVRASRDGAQFRLYVDAAP